MRRLPAVLTVVMLLAGCGDGNVIDSMPDVPVKLHHRTNGPLWFLSGKQPGSVFGQSGPLYRLDPDGHLVRVPVPEPLYNITSIAAAPDGRSIAVSEGGGEFPPRNISLLRPDNADVTRLTRGSFYEITPSWSPDGRWLAFSSTRCCTTGDASASYALYAMRRDGTALHRVFRDTQSDVTPAWSPDGRKIAFVQVGMSTGRWSIWTVRTDGTQATQLTNDGRLDEAVVWSPDATRLAYSSHLVDDRDWQLRVMNADGSHKRTLFRCARLCTTGTYWLAWSPDGQTIAFVVAQPRATGEYRYRLAMIDANGERFHIVDTEGHNVCCITWTASG